MALLRLSKNWRLEQRDAELFITGGQDAIYIIDLPDDSPSFFAKLKHDKNFSDKNLSNSERIVLEQLLSAEIVVPTLEIANIKKPKIKIIGDKLKIDDKDSSFKVTAGADFDLLVIVRAINTLKGFLESQKYLSIKKPHIFLDLPYQHTISLGPLVFPGTTSCLACLEGRLKTRWGDDMPPPRPRASDELSGLALEWLKVELEKIFKNQDYSLANKTVVFDVETRAIDTNKLLTVPLCPYCKKAELFDSGKLEYTLPKA